LIGFIAWADSRTAGRLSCPLLYFLPVAFAAWGGGFAEGVLCGLAATVAWHLSEFLAFGETPPEILLWNASVRFGMFVVTSSLLARLRGALLREQALARTDALTGVANGRTFYEAAGAEIERFSRTSRPFTVAYLDLDNFKAVNDRLGHAAGDRVLRQVATVLRANTRSLDTVARLGGDEFAVLLPETAADNAIDLLDRLRETLLSEVSQGGWPISCSIGAATFLRKPRNVDDMIQRVDALMYKVKRQGKAQLRHVTVWGDTEAVETWPKFERRASVRLLCHRPARVVGPDGPSRQEWIVTVRDISEYGVALWADCRLPEGTPLTIEALGSGEVKTLLGQVVRVAPDERGWLHGCELASRLRPEEVTIWQVAAAAPEPVAAS
jgi:diguanylate cyclase (GGDEF)-like protein